MNDRKAFIWNCLLLLFMGGMGCQSSDESSAAMNKANELDVTDEDSDAAIDDATGASQGATVDAGDEADFINADGGKENLGNETGKAPDRENMFSEDVHDDGPLGENPMNQDVLPTNQGNPNAVASDIDPVAQGSDQAPIDLAQQTAQNQEAIQPKPMAVASKTPKAQETAANADEIEPAASLLSWVGYRIAEKERQVKVEIFSQGHPDFEMFEETNKAQQLELVLRFYQTRLRRKIRWDINSSEFPSPLAYIRMREYKDKGVVDVVLTHREAVMPLFYARDGRIQLVYSIPEHYFSQAKATAKVVKDRGLSLVAGNEAPLRQMPSLQKSGPEHIGHRRRTLFQNEPTALRPIKDLLRSHKEDQPDEQGLPSDFDRRTVPIVQRAALYKIVSFSLGAVAQDDLNLAEDDSGEVDDSNEANAVKKQGNAEAESSLNEEAGDSESVQEVPTETQNSGDGPLPGGGANLQRSEPNKAQKRVPKAPTEVVPTTAAGEPALVETTQAQAPEPQRDPVSNVSIADEAGSDPVPATEQASQTAPQETAIEMTGQSNPNAGQKYVGKPIFMEFYEAPLSVVLKSFSEETRNNFVYSSAVGTMPVTVHFNGVPWDEALKAILETYSLGMVRIGENVVRIDQVTRLTQYMQELEQAKQYEVRRVPTKVLVFRLNNGVAKDVVTRLAALLAQDIALDPRTKLQADDRTNSIIMEASTQVLAKTKAIIERLDLETPQVEIASRIVAVQKNMNNFFGLSWANNFNFDPGRALGFGSLNFPNSVGSSFAVDPGVNAAPASGLGRFRFGSLNKFVDLDLLLKMEEKKGTTNILQSNRVLILDGKKGSITAGSSNFFRPAAGAVVPGAGQAAGGAATLAEVKFNLSLEVTPQITALGSVIMDLLIRSDSPGDPTGEALASKNTRELTTQMVRASGDTGVIGGIYDTSRTTLVSGVPFLSDIPILGMLFRSSSTVEKQTELLIMVTPTIVSGRTSNEEETETASIRPGGSPVISTKDAGGSVGRTL